MIKRWICLVLLLAVSLPSRGMAGDTYLYLESPMQSGVVMAGDLYVATDGSDTAVGSLEEPLLTLQEALARLSQRPDDDAVTIWMRGGTYPFYETLYLAGAFSRSITIRAYPGEVPVISGAERVSGWAATSYMGGTIWSTPYDAAEVRALYGDDGARQVSRWPKEGTLKVSRAQKVEDDKFQHHNTFYVDPAAVPYDLTGATVRLLHWWKDELSGVQSYDHSSGLLTMNRPSAMTITKGDEYWLENIMGVTLAPGEWVFDASNRMLYYAPKEGETPENTPLYVGMLEQLISLVGVANITFDGITFARTSWSIPKYDIEADFPQAAYDAGAAIRVRQARNIRFRSCTFRDIGAGCIRFDDGVEYGEVFNCSFSNIGAHAVYVHGVNTQYPAYLSGHFVIENNEIRGYGRNFLNAAAVLIIHAYDVDICYNEIHDGTYTAISAGWVWGEDYNVTDQVQIRNNLIYYIGQGLLSDMGAIYMLGQQHNSIITGNIIHDVTMSEYGGWGIYLDEGSAGIHVTNNLVYRCSAQGFHQHNGNGNFVTNNIFAFNLDGQVGASGQGAFELSRNVLAGGKPYVKKEEASTVRQSDNINVVDGSIFVDWEMGNFAIRDEQSVRDSGFVPWVYMAGRYDIQSSGGD